jgi:O-antigen ligase
VTSHVNQHGKTLSVKAIWIALIIGAFVQIRVAIPHTAIFLQVSVFDAVLPSLVFWGIFQGWLLPPSKKLTLIFALLLLSILVHSTFIFVLTPNANATWLAKDTIRIVTVVLHFGFLLILFRAADMRSAPRNTVAVLLVIVAIYAAVAFKTEVFQGGKLLFQDLINFVHIWPLIISPTIQTVMLLGLLFVIASDAQWIESISQRLWMISGALLVTAASVFLLNKASAGVAVLFGAWFMVGGSGNRIPIRRLLLVCAFALILVGVFGSTIYQIEMFPDIATRMDSLDRSIGIRQELWTFALHKIMESFPFGLGLGQFSQAAGQIPKFASETHFYPHNTPLSLLVELGFLGLVFVIGTCVVLYQSCLGFSKHALPLFILLMAPPLLIHDGHTIRILLLITAIGLMNFQSRPQSST